MKPYLISRRSFRRQLATAVAIAGALSAVRAHAQGVVYDNWSAVDNGVSGAGVIASVGVPDSFIGGALLLAPGTTDITGLDIYPTNQTDASNINTNINFSNIKLNIYFWGSVNTAGTNATNPAFSDPLTASPLSLTINGTLEPGYYFNIEDNHVLPGISLNTPLVVPSSAVGLTVEVQGSTDGVNYADYPGLTTYISGGSVAPAVGSNLLQGWYRNANSETNGNFTSSLRVSGDAYTTIGTDIYGDGPPKTYFWSNTSGGTWTDSNDWSPAGVPGGNDTAIFNNSSTSPYTILIPSLVTNKNVNVFNDQVTLDLPQTTSQTYFSNSLTVGLANSAGGTATAVLNLTNHVNATTSIVEAGDFVIGGNGGTGTLTIGKGVYVYSDSDLSIANGSSVVVQPFGYLRTQTLTFAGTSNSWQGQLDLTTNHLIVYNGSIGTIMNQLKTGYNNGAWNGQGIISSTAAGDTAHLTAVGAIVNNDGNGNQLYGNTSTGAIGLFDGENPPVNSILLKETFYGDANLDGTVDGSDYSLTDNGFLNHLSGWYNGDFNYDGVVNGSDYTLLDNSFNMQDGSISPDAAVSSPGLTQSLHGTGNGLYLTSGTTPAAYPIASLDVQASTTAQVATTAVPEPASLTLLATATLPLLTRRRRTT